MGLGSSPSHFTLTELLAALHAAEDFVAEQPGPYLVELSGDAVEAAGSVPERIASALGRDARVVSLADGGPALLLGRAGGPADVGLPACHVSKRHAQLMEQSGRWRVVDLESANGTYLAGRRLPVGVPTPIESGQVLRLGTYPVVFLSAADLCAVAAKIGARSATESTPAGRASLGTAGRRAPPIPPSGILWRELCEHAHHVPEDPFCAVYPGPFLVELPDGVEVARPGSPAGLATRLSRLRGKREVESARVHHLGGAGAEGLVLGRSGSDLIFPCSDVSRRHARFRALPSATIEDLGSVNGTFVDGRRLREATPLREGQVLALGSYRAILLGSAQVHELIYEGPGRARDARLLLRLRESLSTPPEGAPLRTLVRKLAALEADGRLEEGRVRFLVHVPVKGAGSRPVGRVEDADLAATQPFSRSAVLGLKGGRRLAKATVHVALPPSDRGLRVGRSAECDFVLAEDTVSKVHAELRLREDEWGVVDLGSHNGTWIDRERLPEGIFSELAPGATVCFSSYLALWLDLAMLRRLLAFVRERTTARRERPSEA
ncbi:MAG: FHA domain-containing protein [Planctomycetota bacterium]|nr:MAG: FHA domain-containing protein [Planctomycetota bacterium]